MNIRSGLSILGLAASLACGGGGGGGSSSYSAPPPPPADTVYVGGAASGYNGTETTAFYPLNQTTTAGHTITWKWSPGITMMHNVTSGTPAGGPDGVFASPSQSSGPDFTHTFATAGTYHYYCTIHGSAMTGTITVN